MAKTSMINREKKRERLVRKYAARRAELKRIAKDPTKTPEQRLEAQQKLAKLPRELAHEGKLPGIHKSSW
jgi:small subunit ribosomal protein S14